MDANGQGLSGLGNQAEQTHPANNSPNVNIAVISEVEGLLEQVSIRLEKLRNTQLTTQQFAAVSALAVRVNRIVEENVVVTRRVFE